MIKKETIAKTAIPRENRKESMNPIDKFAIVAALVLIACVVGIALVHKQHINDMNRAFEGAFGLPQFGDTTPHLKSIGYTGDGAETAVRIARSMPPLRGMHESEEDFYARYRKWLSSRPLPNPDHGAPRPPGYNPKG